MSIKLTFLGTGEFSGNDGRYHSSCMIENGYRVVQVDCGATVPKSLTECYCGSSGYDMPDALLLTHNHWDHAGGVSGQLLGTANRVIETGRPRNLIIAGEETAMSQIRERIKLDYPFLPEYMKDRVTVCEKDRFGANELDAEHLKEFGNRIGFVDLRAARTNHSAPNLAYRFYCSDGYSFALSGDGSLTETSRALFEGTDLLIHEGFHFGSSTPSHQGIEEVVDYCIERGIPNLALVHLEAPTRLMIDNINKEVERAREKGVNVCFPDDHSSFEIDEKGARHQAKPQ